LFELFGTFETSLHMANRFVKVFIKITSVSGGEGIH
jgi:hypothetical protein